MDVSAVSSTLALAGSVDGPRDRNTPLKLEDIKKVASQFEAIIVRQLLKPAIDPIMSGEDGPKGGAMAGGGGGVYGFMLTDVLANSLSKGSGLGLAQIIEQQLTPAALKAAYAQGQDKSTSPATAPVAALRGAQPVSDL